MFGALMRDKKDGPKEVAGEEVLVVGEERWLDDEFLDSTIHITIDRVAR